MSHFTADPFGCFSLFLSSGEFRIQQNGTDDCLSIPPTSQPGSPVIMGSCDGRMSEWLFTLTGGLMVSHVLGGKGEGGSSRTPLGILFRFRILF